MKVFVSWSGSRSRAVAEAVCRWLPDVVQEVRPWFSPDDIPKGEQWSERITTTLREYSQAVVCVTPENSGSPWLNFEAGAIFAANDGPRVRTLLFELSSSDITSPLQIFQHTNLRDAEDMWRFVVSIIEHPDVTLDEERARRAFDNYWQALQNALNAIKPIDAGREAPQPQRTADDMTAEILEIVRGLRQNLPVPRLPETRPGRFVKIDPSGPIEAGWIMQTPDGTLVTILEVTERIVNGAKSRVATVRTPSGETRNYKMSPKWTMRRFVPAEEDEPPF